LAYLSGCFAAFASQQRIEKEDEQTPRIVLAKARANQSATDLLRAERWHDEVSCARRYKPEAKIARDQKSESEIKQK